MIKLFKRLAVLTAAVATLFLAVPQASNADGISGQAPLVIGEVNFANYSTNPIGTRQSDQTIALQNFLLYAQRQYYILKKNTVGLDNNNGRSCIQADVPIAYALSSPLIVPAQVCLNSGMFFQLASHTIISGGTATTAYTGDTTSVALANAEQPMVVLVPNSHVQGKLQVYGTNGTDTTSGVFAGKNWVPASVTQANVSGVAAGQCNGYSINDILTLAQPNGAPFVAPQVTVNSIDGNGCPATWTLSVAGSYGLPTVLQQAQWTAANGWTGSIAAGNFGQVFDPNIAGAFITSGGTGTGAEFTVVWTPDFAGAGADYAGGANLLNSMWLDQINVTSGGNLNDGTYGHQFGVALNGLQFNGNAIVTNRGYYGMRFGATDVHFTHVNPVNASVGLKIKSGSSVRIPNLVIDTPIIHAMEIDQASGIWLRGTAFEPSSQTGNITDACVQLGQQSGDASHVNVNLDIDMQLSSCNNTATPVPAVQAGYTRGSKVNFNVSAYSSTSATTVTNPSSNFVSILTGWDASNTLTGRIDNIVAGNPAILASAANVVLGNISVYNVTTGSIETGATSSYSTNALSSPQFLNLTPWSVSGATVTDKLSSPLAPDGTATASSINMTADNQYDRQQVTAAASTPICASVFEQSGSSGNSIMKVGDSSNTNTFNMLMRPNGLPSTASNNGTGVKTAFGAVPYTGGWTRYWMLGTTSASNPFFWIFNNPSATGVKDFWGPQVEVNPAVCPGVYAPPPPLGAFADGSITAPVFPANTTTFFMQGLAATCTAGTCSITPKRSGIVQFIISGTINAANATTVNNGVTYELYYGTGSAPANAAAVTGTQCSNQPQTYTSAVAPTATADVNVPFSLSCTASGLALGTTYWFDLAAKSVTTISDMGFVNVHVNATEF